MQDLGSVHALIFHARKHSRVNGGGDARNGNVESQRNLLAPASRAFLARTIKDAVDQESVALVIPNRENLRSDFDEKRLQRPLVPLGEDP